MGRGGITVTLLIAMTLGNCGNYQQSIGVSFRGFFNSVSLLKEKVNTWRWFQKALGRNFKELYFLWSWFTLFGQPLAMVNLLAGQLENEVNKFWDTILLLADPPFPLILIIFYTIGCSKAELSCFASLSGLSFLGKKLTALVSWTRIK